MERGLEGAAQHFIREMERDIKVCKCLCVVPFKLCKCLCVVPFKYVHFMIMLKYVHFMIIMKMLIGLTAYLLAGPAPVAAVDWQALFLSAGPSQRSPGVCVYDCSTDYKAVRVRGRGLVEATRDDEPRPVWTSPPITH